MRNREEKRAIRKQIIGILDTECNGCQYEKGYTNNRICRDVCPVGAKIQHLSSFLLNNSSVNQFDQEKLAAPDPSQRRPWTRDEDIYLLNHAKYFSSVHLAIKLNRTPNSIYTRLSKLKSNEKIKG